MQRDTGALVGAREPRQWTRTGYGRTSGGWRGARVGAELDRWAACFGGAVLVQSGAVGGCCGRSRICIL